VWESTADVCQCRSRLSLEKSFPRPERKGAQSGYAFVYGAAAAHRPPGWQPHLSEIDLEPEPAFQQQTQGTRASQRYPRAIIVPNITMLGSVPTFCKILVPSCCLAKDMGSLKYGLAQA
jgi:hypothetical protein